MRAWNVLFMTTSTVGLSPTAEMSVVGTTATEMMAVYLLWKIWQKRPNLKERMVTNDEEFPE